jgi:hypothetical protein
MGLLKGASAKNGIGAFQLIGGEKRTSGQCHRSRLHGHGHYNSGGSNKLGHALAAASMQREDYPFPSHREEERRADQMR